MSEQSFEGETEDEKKRRIPPPSAAAAKAAAAAAAAAVAALDPSKPLPKLKARSHKKKKPEELLVNMTGMCCHMFTHTHTGRDGNTRGHMHTIGTRGDLLSRDESDTACRGYCASACVCACVSEEQRAEHEKQRAIEKAVRLAAQAQAAGADIKDLKLPAGLEQVTKQKTKCAHTAHAHRAHHAHMARTHTGHARTHACTDTGQPQRS